MLNLNEKQNTKYCIPLWQRDEQILSAIKRPNVGRIEAHYEKREGAVAVVGFGPSLKDTWGQIQGFPIIFSCSGSHRFLIDRGIIPTYHVEVDPRPHKVALLGEPHPDVIYLPASTCSPKYFNHLEGFNVKLWHVFDSCEEGLRVLPHGEWALTGGCDVGLRCMTIARFFGYTDLHIFGMDGSSPVNDSRHASEHPLGSKSKPEQEVECNGRTFFTTTGMLAAAQGMWHELNMMPDVKATFYGDGLIQEMSKTYVPKPLQEGPSVGFRKPELISAEYRELNRKLHETNLAYGVGGGKHADTVLKLVERMKSKSVLDYGCGKGYLAKELPFPIWEYDPAVLGKDESPRPADLVVCTDVLEHIEPDKLQFVLGDLQRCVRQVGFFIINTAPAAKTLADGRNTHLIVKDQTWWQKKLSKYFKIGKIYKVNNELYVVVGVKPKTKEKAA